jgi:hypothetical protein
MKDLVINQIQGTLPADVDIAGTVTALVKDFEKSDGNLAFYKFIHPDLYGVTVVELDGEIRMFFYATKEDYDTAMAIWLAEDGPVN